jgi:peptide/nickel transport system permease protein
MLALIVVWWPSYTRIIHGQTLALKQQTFVEAARGLGLTNWQIIRHHILPNSTSTLIVLFTMDLGFGILTMASLGFVGVGAQAPSPEWGLAVSINRAHMPDWWWTTFFPGLAIFSIVMAFNLVGDGLRDALDPRARR